MGFNYIYFIGFTLFLILLLIFGTSLEIIYWLWYILSFFLIFRIYSHVRFILLILELITIISLALVFYFLLKTGLEIRFLFLFLCLVVGEASLGLSLIVIRSRIQAYELISLNLLSSFGRLVH